MGAWVQINFHHFKNLNPSKRKASNSKLIIPNINAQARKKIQKDQNKTSFTRKGFPICSSKVEKCAQNMNEIWTKVNHFVTWKYILSQRYVFEEFCVVIESPEYGLPMGFRMSSLRKSYSGDNVGETWLTQDV